MLIVDAAEYVWEHSKELQFGNEHEWDCKTFTSKWIDAKYPDVRQGTTTSGLYWFQVKNHTASDFKNLSTPGNQLQNAVDIPRVASDNLEIFTLDNLCAPDNQKVLTIYNGHEKNVFSRMRSHFSLNNDKTGAIGFEKNAISYMDFRVKVFHQGFITNDLSLHDQNHLKTLLTNSRGREAIESAWRTLYGWPLLCKR